MLRFMTVFYEAKTRTETLFFPSTDGKLRHTVFQRCVYSACRGFVGAFMHQSRFSACECVAITAVEKLPRTYNYIYMKKKKT